jgi:N4-gp56 family major capsid protein
MATNLASKYAKKVDERFKLKSLTEAGINRDYDWSGVSTVTVYSIPTVAMNDYTRTGSARYGTPAELGNSKQDMTLSKDRSFTFTIDRGNYQDTQMTMEAGKALARQIDEVVVPEIDTYRISVMAAAAIAASGTATAAITKDNAYSAFLDGSSYLNDNKVPVAKRIAWVSPSFYKFIKLDPSFIKSSDLSQKMLVNGQVGEVDGVKIVMVPTIYLPTNTAFVLAHPAATVAADKLEDYKTHDNPPGINGWLVEGREIYDAFVLSQKTKALYTHKTAA